MGVLEKCRKRRCYPVPLGEGNEAFVRSLTLDEIDRLQSVSRDGKTWFILACGIVEQNGDQACSAKTAEESDEQWATRIAAELRDIPTDTAIQLSAAIDRVSKPQAAEKLAKN